jgi:quercetin dioxygenase-like cupin family protein
LQRVPVVDDERGIRVGVRGFLRGKGFEVEEAEDARTAERRRGRLRLRPDPHPPEEIRAAVQKRGMMKSVRVVLAAILVSVLPALAEPRAAEPAAERPLALNLADVEWGPPGDRPRYPQGVRTAQMAVDPLTGGPTYFAKFPAGSHFDLHWHTHVEHVAVMSGEVTLVLGDVTHSVSAGGFIVIPAKMNHSWDVPAGGEDAVILVRRGGPADFHFVDEDGPKGRKKPSS